MEPGFTIRADTLKKRLFVTMHGLWTLAILEDYARRQHDAILAAGWTGGEFDQLVDLREQAVQPREVTERAAAIIEGMGALAPRRTAVVVAGALKRMQVSRVTPDDVMRVFDTIGEAERWLGQ